MPQRKHGHARLSVFKGREAKLNKTILQTLAQKAPLTIYDTYKTLKAHRKLRHTRYATVNKRVRYLEEAGYVKKAGERETKAGFQATLYELTAKAYLAIAIENIDLEDFIKKIDETAASTLLADIFQTHTLK